MITLVKDSKERVRFMKFMTVGFIGSLVDFFVMNLLAHFFSLALTLSGSISFICAVASNFIWNRYWTYPDSRSRPVAKQLSMFFVVNFAGILIRILILLFTEPLFARLTSLIEQNFLDPDVLARNVTLALAIAIVMVWNYMANRYWTYNDINKVNS